MSHLRVLTEDGGNQSRLKKRGIYGRDPALRRSVEETESKVPPCSSGHGETDFLKVKPLHWAGRHPGGQGKGRALQGQAFPWGCA